MVSKHQIFKALILFNISEYWCSINIPPNTKLIPTETTPSAMRRNSNIFWAWRVAGSDLGPPSNWGVFPPSSLVVDSRREGCNLSGRGLIKPKTEISKLVSTVQRVQRQVQDITLYLVVGNTRNLVTVWYQVLIMQENITWSLVFSSQNYHIPGI